MMVFPAHGALGSWDEVIFFGVVILFVGFMARSWLRGQSLSDDLDVDEAATPTAADENHFPLR
ncbi:hypothetical protein HC776_00675 [bacterium]|nr:hypothetical protein [bacterium]